MPSRKSLPLGPAWVRVLSCLFGMSILPVTVAAIGFAPNHWVAATALPASVSVYFFNAHTLHTGSPPPLRPMLRFIVDAFTRWRRRGK